MVSPDDRLDPDRIQTNLRTRRVGTKVLVYERTASTNDVVAECARNPDNSGLVVFAEEQTAGRGRSGAKWHSASGQSLLFSLLLGDCSISGELLSLTCAVAVAEAIGQAGAHHAAIKWPNDIILAGKKVAGILVESKQNHPSRHVIPAKAGLHTHIIGIGINCHQTLDDFAPQGVPVVEDVAGRRAVTFNGSSYFEGPLSVPGIQGAGTRSIEVWAYNGPDFVGEETMVSWSHRGGPAGTNIAFNYGNHGTWGAVGHWDAPDMPWGGSVSP